MCRKALVAVLLLLPIPVAIWGQQAVKPLPDASSPPNAPPSDYVLGPFDQIAVVIGQFGDQFGDKTFRVDGQGDVSLPLVGRLHAAGLTLHDLEDLIKERLGPILKHPDVVVNITEFSSQTAAVLGAVNTPGVQKLMGSNSLFSVLSRAGGLDLLTAGTTVKITREMRWGSIPWAGASTDVSSQVSTATIRVNEITQAGAKSLAIMPGDTIFVPKAAVVYAVGSVIKPGGFPIGETEALSALQVVSLAGGLAKTAAGAKAKILRTTAGSPTRIEIAVNIKKLMAGKTTDIYLQPADILFVPNSGAKSAGARAVDAIVGATEGLVIYGSKF